MKPIADTFVLIAPDCDLATAIAPVAKGEKLTVPAIQYELLTSRPYELTLEDLIFETHVRREGLTSEEVRKGGAGIREELFRKPHPCMRASALTKKYGFGVHHDSNGRMAMYPVESAEYRRFAEGEVPGIKRVLAMRSKRA